LNVNHLYKICKLINLEKLFLNECKITNLIPELGNLVNLKSLALHGNKITNLIPELGRLQKLDMLLLDNCTQLINPYINGEILLLKNLPLPSGIKRINCVKFYNYGNVLNNLQLENNELIIHNLFDPLINLPTNLNKLTILNCHIEMKDIIIPYGCELIIV